MDALFFIAIPSDEPLEATTRFHWVQYTDNKSHYGYDTLSDLQTKTSENNCIAVVSGTNVFETHSELTIKNRKQLEQALRYDLEEQLATEVDSLHFAYQRNTDNTLDVGVIDTLYLASILDFFLDHAITLQSLVSETALLNQAPEAWLIIANEQQLLLKAQQHSYAIDIDNLELSLSSLKQELPENIPVYSVQALALESTHTQFKQQTIKQAFVQLCQYYTTDNPPLNLLQGQFQVKTPKSWRLLIGGALFSFSLLMAITLYQGYQGYALEQQDADLKNTMTSLYKQSFPKARRIVNPVSQMRSQLKQRQSAQNQQGDFTPLLATVARLLRTQNDITLLSIEYQKTALTIQLSTHSLSQLESLKNKLSQQGLEVKLSDINKDNNRVLAQLTIKGVA